MVLPRWRDCESIRLSRKRWDELTVFRAKFCTMWDKDKAALPNLEKLGSPIPLALKIQEYFHSLWSVGTSYSLVGSLVPTRRVGMRKLRAAEGCRLG